MNSDIMNAPSAKSQHLVTVQAWGTDYWAGHSGGEVSSDSTEVWNGGADQPDYIAGRSKTSNITVTKPYYPGRDRSRLLDLMRRVGKLRTTITVQDTDPDFNGGVYGSPMVYPNALLVRAKNAESEAGSADADTLELEFSVPGLAPA